MKLKKELQTKGFQAILATVDLAGILYRVQVGAYSQKSNAEAMKKRLKDVGYDSVIVQA